VFFFLSIAETMPYVESKTRRGTDKGKSGLSTKSSIEIDQPVFAFTPLYRVLGGETTYINFIVFGLTRLGT
jgi:hypothetical protein